MSANHHLLDEPILSADQDSLGRGDFANSVADLILTASQGSSSQVIGLYGKWGEGKTSLKNMVLETYRKICKLPPIVVEFSPWTYTSRERLPFLFFTEIAHVFGNETKDEKAQKLADQFKHFGQILEIVSLVPQLTLFAMWVKPILNFFGTKYADQTKNLESVRKQIHDMMADEPRRLIVVVDDLDRISSKEVRRMIQLVKANGDFPNITYLLLCDRDYVSRALCTVVDGCNDEEGREYLEKVVTFGLDLPRIRTYYLRNYLINLVQDVLTRQGVGQTEFDLDTELPPLVYRLVHDLRDIKRLVAGFEFQLAAHRKISGGTANVHIGDLIVIEAYRLFEPTFFHALYESRAELMCENSSLATRYIEKEASLSGEWLSNHLCCKLSPRHMHTSNDFFHNHLGWHLSGGNFVRTDVQNSRIACRLMHPDCFDCYFTMHVDPTLFFKSDFLTFTTALTVKDQALAVIRQLFKNGRLRDFLSNIESSFTVDDRAQQENFVTILTITAEFARDNLQDMHVMHGEKFGFTLATHLHRCVRFFLERALRSTEERSALLMKVFTADPDALVLPISILSAEHASRDRKAAVPQLLMDSDYAELNRLCLERIEERQKQGKLIGHIDERDIRRMWVTIGNPEHIKASLANDLLSYPSVMNVLLPFTGYVSSSEGTFFTIHLDWLEQFIDPKKVLALLMTQSQLPQAEAGLRDCLAYCIEAKLKGQSYDHDAQMKQVYKRYH